MIQELFTQEYLFHPAIGLTVRVTLLGLLLQVLAGVPLGLYLAGRKSILKSVVDTALTLPMIFPPMALGFFLLLLLGRNGIIGGALFRLFDIKIIFSFWGLLLAIFIVGLPFMVKSVQSSRQQMNNSLIEAAATLGKRRHEILLRVILPGIKNGIVTGVFLAFGRSMGEVGISMILGGNIVGRTETLSLAIYNSVFEGQFQRAAIFSIMLSVMAIIIMAVVNLANRGKIPFTGSGKNQI